jgi:myosin-crossreactive antigen
MEKEVLDILDIVHKMFLGKYATIEYVVTSQYTNSGYKTSAYWELYVQETIKFEKFNTLAELRSYINRLYKVRSIV